MVVCTQTCEFTFVAKGSQALKRCEISDEKERRKAERPSYVRVLLFYFSGEKPKTRHNFYLCLTDYNICVHKVEHKGFTYVCRVSSQSYSSR